MADRTDRLSVDAGAAGLIAHLGGVGPAAPAWFEAALAEEPCELWAEVAGARVQVLAWGDRGAPGLLLLHGNGAHAHWWSHLAPFWAAEGRRVAALTWSGMGDSDWRSGYALEQFGQEALAAAERAGLFEAREKPIIAAHSFGGFPALYLGQTSGERFGGIISIDSPIMPPGTREDGPPSRSGPNRIYPTFEAALARFRLAPPQPCENLYLVDHIARGSIKAVEGGFTWKFDPDIWRRMAFEPRPRLLSDQVSPLAIVWGARSGLMTPHVVDFMRATAPKGTPFVAIPEADHHVLLDQPLALVAVVRALLAGWG